MPAEHGTFGVPVVDSPVVDVPVLSRSAHDRIGARRTDERWVGDAWRGNRARVLLLSESSTSPIDENDQLLLFASSDPIVHGARTATRVLLGEAGGMSYFALLGVGESTESQAVRRWAGLRDLAVTLDDLSVGLLTAAVALHAWHVRHTHCPRCGSPTEVVHSGWARRCPTDRSEHFPRTDPAVIMLVTDDRDRCLLARSAAWPWGRLSVLAGFVEAGESAESAVVREVREEVGVDVAGVRYVASQPHPFPASLMLGFTARAQGDTTLKVDGEEIVEAAWFTRDEVSEAVDWGHDEHSDHTAMLRALPGRLSIARQLIDTWLAQT
jgi:NAD+ diphosphatase